MSKTRRTVSDVLVEEGLIVSMSQGRRYCICGAVFLDGQVVTDLNMPFPKGKHELAIGRKGKRTVGGEEEGQ